MSGVGVCQGTPRRPVATTVRSRPLGIMKNPSFLNGYSYAFSYRYAGIIDRDNRTGPQHRDTT